MTRLRHLLISAHAGLPYFPGKWRLGGILSRSCVFPAAMVIRRRGVRYAIDPTAVSHRHLLVNGVHEPAETAVLRRWLKPGMVALDVGANIGYYALLCSRRVGPSGRVYAFEPTPRTFGLLRRNLDLNPCGKNVEARNCGVGDRGGRLRLVESANYAGCGTNHVVLEAGDTPIITIDSLDLPRLDFVKIDVEGFEARVLRGAEATLRRCRPLLLLEVNTVGLERCGDSARGVVEFLQGLGYVLRRPTWKGLRPFTEPGSGEWPNAFAFPDPARLARAAQA